MLDQMPLSNKEKIHYTNSWCRSIGIKSKDLETHRSIDDAILLIRFHQANWFYLTQEERGVWAAYWSYVYHNQFNLKKKHLNKLEIIQQSIIFRLEKQKQRQATIKALRQRIQANAIEQNEECI